MVPPPILATEADWGGGCGVDDPMAVAPRDWVLQTGDRSMDLEGEEGREDNRESGRLGRGRSSLGVEQKRNKIRLVVGSK